MYKIKKYTEKLELFMANYPPGLIRKMGENTILQELKFWVD